MELIVNNSYYNKETLEEVFIVRFSQDFVLYNTIPLSKIDRALKKDMFRDTHSSIIEDRDIKLKSIGI